MLISRQILNKHFIIALDGWEGNFIFSASVSSVDSCIVTSDHLINNKSNNVNNFSLEWNNLTIYNTYLPILEFVHPKNNLIIHWKSLFLRYLSRIESTAHVPWNIPALISHVNSLNGGLSFKNKVNKLINKWIDRQIIKEIFQHVNIVRM